METMQPNRGPAAPPRPAAAAAQQAQVAASLAGAVDLGAIRARAEAAERAAATPPREGGSYVIDVTEATFQTEVIDRSFQTPVIVDLRADWSPPSQELSPVLERLAAEGGGAWILARVDIDSNPRLAQALQVQSVPVVKAVMQGALAAEFNGALPEPEIRTFLAAVVQAAGGNLPAGATGSAAEDADPGEDVDPRLDAAEIAVAGGDFAAAETAYAEILADEPDHPIAGLALEQIRLLRRAEAAGPTAIADADADPTSAVAALAAADVELAQGQVERAFDRLLAVITSTTGKDRDTAREGLVELFALVGDDDPLVIAARKKLTAALF